MSFEERRWSVRLFGSFRLLGPDGSDATPSGRKARALFACVVLADGEVVSRDRLATLLWSERGDDQARASMRQTFYEMRALTNGADAPIRIDRSGARAVVARLTSDFRQLCGASDALETTALATLLGDRPADLLVDLDGLDPAFDEWLAAERVRCHHERRRCALAASERALALRDAVGAERIARRLLACDATDEAAARIAMEGSHRQGDRDAVRRTFMQLREALRIELQVDVAEETAALHRQLIATGMPGRTTVDVTRATAANEESPEAPAATSPSADRPPMEERSLVAIVVRRRATIAAMCGIVALGAVYAAHRAQRTPEVRTLRVEPLNAAATDSAALALRVGFSADLARLIVGNDATLRVVDASSSAEGSASDTFRVDGDASSNAGLVHATVRVLHDANGPILWSRTFVRPIEQIEALRVEMASKVGDVSICALGHTNPEAAVFSPEEMRLMFGACDQKHLMHADETNKLFEQLLVLRPDYAHGWAMLAVSRQFSADGRPADADAVEAEAERDAQRALALDPADGEAYYARALGLRGIAQWPRRMEILERGHVLDPSNGQIDNAIARDLEVVGRWQEAAAFHQRAVDADPFGVFKAADLAHVLGFGGDPAAGIVALEEGRKRFGNHRAIRYADFEFNAMLGDPGRALAMLADADRGFALPPARASLWSTLITDRANPSPDHDAKANAAIDQAMKSPDSDVPLIVETLARAGRVDEAYAFIDRLASTMQTVLPTEFLFDVLTRSMRADPRFMTVAARTGLVPIWQQTDRWPDFCREPGLAYDCKVEARRAMSPEARPLVARRPTG